MRCAMARTGGAATPESVAASRSAFQMNSAAGPSCRATRAWPGRTRATWRVGKRGRCRARGGFRIPVGSFMVSRSLGVNASMATGSRIPKRPRATSRFKSISSSRSASRSSSPVSTASNRLPRSTFRMVTVNPSRSLLCRSQNAVGSSRSNGGLRLLNCAIVRSCNWGKSASGKNDQRNSPSFSRASRDRSDRRNNRTDGSPARSWSPSKSRPSSRSIPSSSDSTRAERKRASRSCGGIAIRRSMSNR